MNTELKEDIKNRLSVEEVIGSYIELKRAGRNLKALSPFTNEKTPSFMVSPEKQIWHDFSSGKGGDIFTFVMEMEGVDFIGALEILARRAGVDMSKYSRTGGHTAKLKERIRRALTYATKFYQASLSKKPQALDYLTNQRELSPETIELFALGYSPISGTALVEALRSKGFSEKEITAAGLGVKRRGQLIDMFRGRIMIPLKDSQGQTIGFTARLLNDDSQGPKYINTPQTLLYDKSRHVYGLSEAKESIRTNGYSVLVEGNFDVISSHQYGFTNAVAIAGTALTKGQLLQLGRLAEDIRLAFDQDEPGLKATERALSVAQDLDVSLSVISIPDGKDPDELLKNSRSSWESAINKHQYIVDWLVDHYASKFDLSKAEGKKLYSDKIIEVISQLNDPIEVDHYLQVLADRLNVSIDKTRTKLENHLAKSKNLKLIRPKQKTSKKEESDSSLKLSFYDDYLGLILKYPDARESTSRLSRDDFEHKYQKAIFDYATSLEGKPAPKQLPKELQQAQNYVNIITFRTEEIYGDKSMSQILVEAISLARRIGKENRKKLKMNLTARIREAEDAGDDKLASKLLKQYQKLLKEA